MRGNWSVSAAAGVAVHTVLVLPCVIEMVGISYILAGCASPEEPRLLVGGIN
jgi:hypothetical protein